MERGTPHRAARRDDRYFELVALLLFAVVVSALAALHEPWNAETQSWRLAIDSDGLAALAHNARYEGHPLLFHFLLQLVGHLSRAWWAAVATNVVIACTSAWVVLRFAPFGRLERGLVIAGYFPLYEYGTHVREYGLGMLFAFAACAAWSADRRRWVVAIVCLVLMANTSVLGLLLALAAGAAFVVDWMWGDAEAPRITRRMIATGVVLLAAGAVLAALLATQVMPPGNAGYKGDGAAVRGGVPFWTIAWGLTIPLRAMVPLSPIGEGTVQWNQWLFEPTGRGMLGLELLLTLGLFIVGCVVTMRRRTALLFFVVATVGLVLFFELFVLGSARHHGHLMIAWVMAAWLARAGPPTVWSPRFRPLAERARRAAPRLLALSLVPMVVAGAEFAVADAILPFSDVYVVADLLRARGLVDRPIVGVARSNATAVGAILDRDVVLPREGRSGKFVIWGVAGPEVPPAATISRATDSILARECDLVVISTFDEDVPVPLRAAMRPIYDTPYRPMSRERFRVWTMAAPASARCPAPR